MLSLIVSLKVMCDICRWLEAEVDAELAVPPSDEGLLLETLVAAAGSDSAAISIIGEGLSVGQGKWPLDRCVGSIKPSSLMSTLASLHAKALLVQSHGKLTSVQSTKPIGKQTLKHKCSLKHRVMRENEHLAFCK